MPVVSRRIPAAVQPRLAARLTLAFGRAKLFLAARLGVMRVPMNKRGADLVRFYRLLMELEPLSGGLRRLAASHAEERWPRRGVVWFFEKGERRTDSGEGLRVVRVATHALKPGLNSTLWDRLLQDREGAHRTSAFRTLVGLALREAMGNGEPASWGRGPNAATGAREARVDPAAAERQEAALEQAVSLYVGHMPFLFLAVGDEPGPHSHRAFIEKNSIALLSNYARPPLDAPSAAWLGRRCGREKVRQAGLWGTQYVDDAYDPSFLDALKTWIDEMRSAVA